MLGVIIKFGSWINTAVAVRQGFWHGDAVPSHVLWFGTKLIRRATAQDSGKESVSHVLALGTGTEQAIKMSSKREELTYPRDSTTMPFSKELYNKKMRENGTSKRVSYISLAKMSSERAHTSVPAAARPSDHVSTAI